jgi:hypothetical protein
MRVIVICPAKRIHPRVEQISCRLILFETVETGKNKKIN